MPLTPAELRSSRHPFVQFAWGMARRYSRGYHHLSSPGHCTIPADGPVILACNHSSGLDPLLLQALSPRVIVWMIAREYYSMPVVRSFYQLIEAIPVDRSGRDLAATRAALRVLEAQRVLGVFPEGRIAHDENLLPFQTGVALLACRTGAPVVPACISGNVAGREIVESLLLPAKITLCFGAPLRFGRKDDLQEVTERIQQAVAALRVQF